MWNYFCFAICLLFSCLSPLNAQQTAAASASAADDTKEILKIEAALLNTYIPGEVADRGRYAANEFVVVDLGGE